MAEDRPQLSYNEARLMRLIKLCAGNNNLYIINIQRCKKRGTAVDKILLSYLNLPLREARKVFDSLIKRKCLEVAGRKHNNYCRIYLLTEGPF